MLTYLKEKWNEIFVGKKETPIEIFVRHCYSSTASAHKGRFRNFSRKGCYQNLIHTINAPDVHATFFLDIANATSEDHFLKQQDKFPVIDIRAGCEALSFLQMLDYVLARDLAPDTIIYFLEDDYVHKPEWIKILREGFSLPNADYVTLFDHKDKYTFAAYQSLQSKIFHTQSCHWRTTPSTTNTYAMRFETLQKHAEIHKKFSLDRSITADHEKFCALGELGAVLVSSIPGWATHVEPEFASPCANWEEILENSIHP